MCITDVIEVPIWMDGIEEEFVSTVAKEVNSINCINGKHRVSDLDSPKWIPFF
jgi:hypothetical protein